jgi:putative glutamine amidotransferase
MAGRDEVMVNSLHGQGINRIAPGLDIEASAPDGIVEAVVVRGADAFALGIQWHPEWRCQENPFSMAIFAAFGSACRTRSDKRKY